MKQIALTLHDEHQEFFGYPGGERQVRLKAQCTEKITRHVDITITARLNNPSDIIDLLLLCDCIDGLSPAIGVRLILPYLPYARADRRFTHGDCFGLRAFGQMLASAGVLEVITLDVHSKVAFANIPNLVNVDPLPFIRAGAVHFDHEGGDAGISVLYPDDGAMGRYASDAIGFPVAFATKKRDAETGKLLGFEVPRMAGRILIVDDICDGGGTFLGIADKLQIPREQLALYVTHGIFSNGALPKLAERFSRIYTTDSFRVPMSSQPGLKVMECAERLAEAVGSSREPV